MDMSNSAKGRDFYRIFRKKLRFWDISDVEILRFAQNDVLLSP